MQLLFLHKPPSRSGSLLQSESGSTQADAKQPGRNPARPAHARTPRTGGNYPRCARPARHCPAPGRCSRKPRSLLATTEEVSARSGVVPRVMVALGSTLQNNDNEAQQPGFKSSGKRACARVEAARQQIAPLYFLSLSPGTRKFQC